MTFPALLVGLVDFCRRNALFVVFAAVLLVIVACSVLGVLTYQGMTSPWSPKMQAWSGDTVPERYVHNATPLGRQGQIVFQDKQCRNNAK